MNLHLFLIFRYLTLIGCFCVLGCLPKNEVQSSRTKGAVDPGFFDNVTLTRLAGGNQLLFSFDTKVKIHCKLSYYSLMNGATPTQENLTEQECSTNKNSEGSLIHKEYISGLKIDDLYAVVVYYWLPTQSPGEARVSPVFEESAFGQGDDGKFRELFVAKFDVPTRFAEVHRHKLPSPLPLVDLDRAISNHKVEYGCQNTKAPNIQQFSSAEADVNITNLATKDLGVGNAKKNPRFANRLLIPYQNINYGMNQWTLIYSQGGRDIEATVKPIAQFKKVEGSSNEAFSISGYTLDEHEYANKIQANKDLTISWQAASVRENDYIVVNIVGENTASHLHCISSATTDKIVIPTEAVNKLEQGSYYLTVELISRRFIPTFGWMVYAMDWRFAKIENL